MSVQSNLVGYIEEAWAGGEKHQLLLLFRQENEKVLQSLPDAEPYPPLCRTMFSYPPAETRYVYYLNRLIHFGASLKNFDYFLFEWLGKFERLLRQLYWESAYVRLDGGYLGTCEFHWEPVGDSIVAMREGEIRPPLEWKFQSSIDMEVLKKLGER